MAASTISDKSRFQKVDALFKNHATNSVKLQDEDGPQATTPASKDSGYNVKTRRVYLFQKNDKVGRPVEVKSRTSDEIKVKKEDTKTKNEDGSHSKKKKKSNDETIDPKEGATISGVENKNAEKNVDSNLKQENEMETPTSENCSGPHNNHQSRAGEVRCGLKRGNNDKTEGTFV